MKKMCYCLLLTFICIGFTSCDKDEKDGRIYDLDVYSGIYTVAIGNSSYIAILSGNRDYVFTPENDEVVSVSYTAKKNDNDYFLIEGLEPGKTSVTITDNVTGQTKEITVVVTSMYAALMMADTRIDLKLTDNNRKEEIENRIKAETLLKHNYEFYMMMGEELTFYLFTRGDQNLDDFMNFEGQGTYTLEEAGEIYHLSVNLRDNSYFYELGGRSLAGFTALWKGSQEISRSSQSVYTLTLREDVTELYKKEYQEIEQAYVTTTPTFYPNMFLPNKLFAE